MMKRGQLVMTPTGGVGLVLNIFDAVVYQPMQVELLIGSKVITIPYNKLRNVSDAVQGQTLEELLNSKKQEKLNYNIIKEKNYYG
jgi:hypothetical protein